MEILGLWVASDRVSWGDPVRKWELDRVSETHQDLRYTKSGWMRDPWLSETVERNRIPGKQKGSMDQKT